MASNRTSETPFEQRDPPLWARGLASGLLLFASWWLLNTEAIRSIVGDSIGALCLGVIAASLLRGMHLPFALWPSGPWRKRFSVPAVVSTGAVIATMIMVSRASGSSVLAARLDLGTGIAVVVGAVGLGFGIGFVKQGRYLIWYGIALVLALAPLAGELAIGSANSADISSGLCFFSPDRGQVAEESWNGCTVALVPALVFLTAIGAAMKVVTEEIAFRRMLIGIAPGAGLLSILGSAVVALLWYVLLSRSGVGGTGVILLGTLGAVCAGCIFVLSKSLPVSALFSAVYTAGYWSLTLARADDGATTEIGPATPAMVIAASAVTAALAAVIFKRNGFLGNLREAASTDATRS